MIRIIDLDTYVLKGFGHGEEVDVERGGRGCHGGEAVGGGAEDERVGSVWSVCADDREGIGGEERCGEIDAEGDGGDQDGAREFGSEVVGEGAT